MDFGVNEKHFEVILIGDTGEMSISKPDPMLALLKNKLPQNPNSAVIFLGDNIYPTGLTPPFHPRRKHGEQQLQAIFKAVEDYPGKVIFISGNHDWNKGRSNGFNYVIRQQKYIEEHLKEKVLYLPSKGCPGPEEINVSDYFTIVVINTQWWVQKGFRPAGKQCECIVDTEDEFYEKFKDILTRNKNKRVLIVGHLPLYSYGIHGGKFKIKHHLFPLTIYKTKAYVPLPVIGSIIPLYRKYIGAKEDISHPRYRRMRNKLLDIFSGYSNLIYAAGHEHNLQYIIKNENHYIVSGSGCKTKFVNTGKYSLFTAAKKGFFKLCFNFDKTVNMEVWTDEEKDGKVAYKYTL